MFDKRELAQLQHPSLECHGCRCSPRKKVGVLCADPLGLGEGPEPALLTSAVPAVGKRMTVEPTGSSDFHTLSDCLGRDPSKAAR